MGMLEASVSGIGTRFDKRSAQRWIVGLAACQFLGFSLLWLLLHLPNVVPPVSNGWFQPNATYDTFTTDLRLFKILVTREDVAGAILLGIFGFVCAVYIGAVICTWKMRLTISVGWILVLTTIISLPLLALPQLLSADVYSYAIYGRIPILYGGNPLIDIPAAFPQDPLLTSVGWKTTASVYGPAWILLSLPMTQFAELLGGSAATYVLLYKLLGLVYHLASIVVVSKILEWMRPQTRTWGTLVYSWHPLMLIEFVGGAHNDSLMVLLIFLALAAEMSRRPKLALGLLVVAGMIKLVALLLVPIYTVYVLRKRTSTYPLRLLTQHILLGLSIVVVLYLPFWAGLTTLRVLVTAPPLTILHQSPTSWVHTKLSASQ